VEPHPPRPLLTVPNVTAHPSTASVPITVLLYNVHCCAVLMCPLLYGFNVSIEGLNLPLLIVNTKVLCAQLRCNGCGATSKPAKYTQLVHYVTTHSIM